MSYSFLTTKSKQNNRSLTISDHNLNEKISPTCLIIEEEEEEVEVKEISFNNNDEEVLNVNQRNEIQLNNAKNNPEKISNQTNESELTADKDTAEDINEFNLLDDKIPNYKLRADCSPNYNCDWIRAPSYFDEQQISELTNEQIQFTLDYFIQSGYRVSQMTKTYYDIEAVTKLLDEKEKDLELAATIGKQLLEKDQQLEAKIEYLEIQLEKTTEMVNQLRHDISLKDTLLQSFIDSESDSSHLSLNDSYTNKKSNYFHDDELNDYKKKISDLEDENDLLRNRADFFERETAELETKESVLVENCYRELELSQNALLNTHDELKAKTDEVQKLLSQIFELQLKIKNLTKNNSDLQALHDSSTTDLINQLNEMKEKYNDCLKTLNKTQEEINVLRKKHSSSKRRTSSSNFANSQSFNQIDSIICDEDGSDQLNTSNQSTSSINNVNNSRTNHSLYTQWIPSNSNSLATEVFCSLAKDYQAKHLNLPKQASQSSEFIKKVKQKLTKQLPGSNLDTDSEIDSINNSSISHGISSADLENAIQHQSQLLSGYNGYSKFTNCPTPDSILSTGSASIYSNLLGRSCSFIMPEKLKIVKPIEGSNTLQHWQNLARPNLGCLFETRPGISVKGCNDLEFNFEDKNKNDDLDEYDDGVNLDMYEDESQGFNDESSVMLHNYNQELSYFDTNEPKPFMKLSPTRIEFLSRLLENEEREQTTNNDSSDQNDVDSKENNIFLEMFKTLSKKYFNKNDSTAEIEDKKSFRNKYEFDDPDTPPSSPINTPINNKQNLNILYDVFESAKLKCKSAIVEPFSTFFQQANAPTPPGTPSQELDEDYINSEEFKSQTDKPINNEISKNQSEASQSNFFEQIVSKLNLFSFKTVSNVENEIKKINDKPFILKPLPIYANKSKSSPVNVCEFTLTATDHVLKEKGLDNLTNEDEEIKMNMEIKENLKNCETPPSSPSKFSPPLLYEENDSVELNNCNSAFVRVASLNPYINKSIDLASLLGSLSSLKRNQRLCKYY